MKAEAEVRAEPMPVARTKLFDYLELSKPRIALMSLVATLTGFYMASDAGFDFVLAFHALLGTGLVAAGASALNEIIERDHDARMERTRNRPLPARRLTKAEALRFSVPISVGGVVYLLLMTNALAALLAALTFVLYIFVYTPLKRRSSLNTLVGAVPGALPPLIGWAAVDGALPWPAWTLFAILFIWQLPHFGAIAWLYREDYERGGFKMMSVVDPSGRQTAMYIVSFGLALILASLTPTLIGLTGTIYMFSASALGIALWAIGLAMARKRSRSSARVLLLGSVIYLPLLFMIMVVDKVR